MINRKLNQIILALLIIGALVTFWTGEAVRNLREQRAPAEIAREESAVPETKVEPAAGPSINVRKRSSGRYEEFRKKFRETEETLERLQSGRPGDERSVTRKNQAVSELRYWETQLNSLYSCIMAVLPRDEAEALAREQQEWRRRRRKQRRPGLTNCWSGTRTECEPQRIANIRFYPQRSVQEILEKMCGLCYSGAQCSLMKVQSNEKRGLQL